MRIYLFSFLYLSNNASSLNLRLKSKHSTAIIDREGKLRLYWLLLSVAIQEMGGHLRDKAYDFDVDIDLLQGNCKKMS